MIEGASVGKDGARAQVRAPFVLRHERSGARTLRPIVSAATDQARSVNSRIAASSALRVRPAAAGCVACAFGYLRLSCSGAEQGAAGATSSGSGTWQ